VPTADWRLAIDGLAIGDCRLTGRRLPICANRPIGNSSIANHQSAIRRSAIANRQSPISYDLGVFFRSAQRFFIISEMRLRASGDILRRRRFRPVKAGASPSTTAEPAGVAGPRVVLRPAR
jgi:hypothetical protein